MDPTQYGPSAWLVLHAFAGNATEEPKRIAFAQWMKLWPSVFPCEVCATHLAQTMKVYKIEQFMSSAEQLLKYTYILHDAANNSYIASHPGKPRKISPPWEDVKAMYLSVPTPPPSPVAVQASSSKPPTNSGNRMIVTYPAFQQLKSNFRPVGKR